MKTIAIIVDMRNSSVLNLKKKKEEYKKLYSQFNNYNFKEGENISFYKKSFVGDAAILTFKCANLNNKREIHKLLKEIDSKVKNISSSETFYGIGISYSETFNAGQDLLISPSLDFASISSSLANKHNVKNLLWSMKLNVHKDFKNDVEELLEVINLLAEKKEIDIVRPNSKKHIYFNFL